MNTVAVTVPFTAHEAEDEELHSCVQDGLSNRGKSNWICVGLRVIIRPRAFTVGNLLCAPRACNSLQRHHGPDYVSLRTIMKFRMEIPG